MTDKAPQTLAEASAAAAPHLGEALRHLSAGNRKAAGLALEQAKRLAPEHPQVYYLMAELAILKGRRDEAIQHATTALGWERKQPQPFALLGRLMHLEGDSPTAARLLERALALDPGFMPAQLALREVREQPVATTRHPELAMLGRKPTIALCMIVKNEAKSIARCLASARPHVDELVVVDTGSTDGTAELAEVMGARVLHFPWVDDFAAARNFALDSATTDWALVLDADEELEMPPGALHQLIDTLPWPDYTGVLPLVSVKLYNFPGSPVSRDVWEAMPIPRIFPRAATRYKGAAHETPELPPDSRLKLKAYNAFNVELQHHGYRPEVMKGRDKLSRNIELMRQRLAADPGDMGVYYLLGRELVFDEQHEAGLEALARYDAALTEAQRPHRFRLTPFLQATALGHLDRHEEALAVLDQAIEADPDFPSYHYLRGEKLAGLGRYDEAIAAYDRAMANADYQARHPLANFNAVVPAHAGSLAQIRKQRAIALRDGAYLAQDEHRRPAEVAIADAMGALAEGDLATARTKLEEAGKAAPTHPQVPYLQAELLLREGDVPGALQKAFASLRLNTGMAEPWAMAGYLLHEDEDSPLGVHFLERALALSPDYYAAQQLVRLLKASPRTRMHHPELANWLRTSAAQIRRP